MDEGEATVSLRFILPKGKTEATCSEGLAFAYESSQENCLNPIWITQDEALKLSPVKTDVFVVDPFEGDAFNHVCNFKCTVIGPRCLLSCLQKGEPVPELPYPMFTAAMRGLVITATGFSKERKTDLKNKVEKMGGIYSNVFHDGVTHLVAEIVRSKKYDVAVNKETPVMTSEWIDIVWTKGQSENIHATDPQFARQKCPALFGLAITVSQMQRKERDLLKKSIESHGGIYSGTLDMNTTGILIIAKPEGDKFKYARKWKIPCVSSDWVFDSIERGYCLPTEKYRIESSQSGSCSTPTKDNVSKLSEVSMCSTIFMPNENLISNVNETINASNLSILPQTLSRGSASNEKSIEQLLVSLDLSRDQLK